MRSVATGTTTSGHNKEVEHQRTKLKVAGSSSAEVIFFSYPVLYSDKPGQAGFGCPGLEIAIMSENLQ